MNFNEYINWRKANGPVDKDGFYGYQCMDLWNDFVKEVLGEEGVGADCAKNILNNPRVRELFDVIENTPDFVPQRGDVAVFTGGTWGHVAIILDANINCFYSLEQNWKPQQLTEEFHDYFYMGPIVFLRAKDQDKLFPKMEEKKTNEEIAEEVKAGLWGVGAERYERIVNAGYNYNEIQAIINGRDTVKKTNEEIAEEVILGLWDVGEERYRRITEAGYDYDAIQAIVNSRI